MAVERVIWVYAVAPVVRREWFGQGDGVGRRPVWGVTIDGLAAAVSGVNAAEYGLEAIEALVQKIDDDLESRAWIRQMARRHHTVIEKIAEHQPVVPMRLATLCADEAEVVSQLTERRDELTRAIARVAAGADRGPKARPAAPAAPGWLRDELGSHRALVRFEDMTRMGRNPAWIIPEVQEFVDAHPGQHVRYVGEPIWPTRTQPEVREATRHEALINLAFAAARVDILCPYDTTRLAPEVIADARRTHPARVADAMITPSRTYAGPGSLPTSCEVPLTALADGRMSLTYTTDLAPVRALVEKRARAANLPESKIIDLVLAVSEVAANTLRHTSSPGTLDIWNDDREIVCTISDQGAIADPLAGRRRPAPDAGQGHGLWLVHQVCDLVELRSDGSGTTIRLHMTIPGS